MNKKIIIIIVAAVVVIAAAAGAVAYLRSGNSSETETTQATATDISGETYSMEDYTDANAATDIEPTAEAYTTNADGTAYVTLADGQTSAVSTTAASPVSDITTTAKSIISSIKGVISGNKTTTTAKATTKAAAKTTAKSTTKATTTTKKASSGGSAAEKVIGDDAEQSLLGYRYSSDGYYYCDDKDNWQKYTGYNEVYDKWAGAAGMYIDQVRIRFQYEDKNWMIQLWKGQYGFLFIGAEIGVYTCDLDEYSGGTGDLNHFNVADEDDWLYMQLDCYYCKGSNGQYKKIFTRPYDKYWWATGFVEGQLTKYTTPRTELKTKNRITFKSADMANIFVQGLKVSGFKRAAGSDQLIDDSYYCSGKDVWVLWSTIYSDSFVGYSSSSSTTAAATTTTAA